MKHHSLHLILLLKLLTSVVTCIERTSHQCYHLPVKEGGEGSQAPTFTSELLAVIRFGGGEGLS